MVQPSGSPEAGNGGPDETGAGSGSAEGGGGVAITGCANVDPGDDETVRSDRHSDVATSEHDEEVKPVCWPGDAVFCRCLDGSAGVKYCKDDGLSFDQCVSEFSEDDCE